MLKALIVQDQHDQVDAFETDLESRAPAANRNECRRAPTSRRTACGKAASMFASKDEAAFD